MPTAVENSEIITLTEACQLIGISIWHGYRIYHKWPDYGVRVLKHTPTAYPRFYRRDILKMMETRK
jgi:hypothetical protein